MLPLHNLIRMFWVGPILLGAGVVSGQDYPNKSIRLVTGTAGGGSDFSSRLVAQLLTESFGQQVIVDNRAGFTGVEIVRKAQPNGYTLLLEGATFWIGPLLQSMPYDPVTEFLPIIFVTRAPNILVVHPSLPVKSVKELIALGKAKPGALNYGSAGTGSSSHLAAELFRAMVGNFNMVHVPYKGNAPTLTAVGGDEVQLAFAPAATAAPLIKSARIKALAVTSAQPSPLVPGLPTVEASGLPGFEAISLQGMFAPAGTPVTIINRLNREIGQILNKADVKEKFFNTGLETVGSSPGEFAAVVKSEMAKWGKVINDIGIRGK